MSEHKWEDKSRVHIILKNGVQFTVVCDEFTCRHSRTTGELMSCSWEGAVANIPLYIRVNDVSAVFMEKLNTEEENV